MTLAFVVSMRRKSRRNVRCASSLIWPAISTPVGPAPTTTKVSHSSATAGSVHSSASSKDPKIRPRNSRASSMLFIPGANSENWSLPKYDWPAPAATIRVSYRVIVVPSGLTEVTVRAPRSMSVTRPRRTVALACFFKISRVAGATSPSESTPVATWYSRGWNKWCDVMLIIVMSTGALASASVAHKAPKPEPMTTTRCRPDPSLAGVDAAEAAPEVSTDIVLSSLSIVPRPSIAEVQHRTTRAASAESRALWPIVAAAARIDYYLAAFQQPAVGRREGEHPATESLGLPSSPSVRLWVTLLDSWPIAAVPRPRTVNELTAPASPMMAAAAKP